MINPKRDPKSGDGRAAWYPYYAGFSPQFVRHVIESSRLPPAALVADPWNGAGTTTTVALESGLRCWGGDANPAMVLVARAKQVTQEQLRASEGVFEKILRFPVPRHLELPQDDPIAGILPREAATAFRFVEREVRILCAEHGCFPEIPEELRSDLALMYLALFRAIRKIAKSSKTKNPTWVRIHREAVTQLSPESVRAVIAECWTEMRTAASDPFEKGGAVTLNVALSQRIPLKSDSVELIITSPPYCTRIDYAISTALELAVLGVTASRADSLRRSLMGTTTVEKVAAEVDDRWGTSCCEFLEGVRTHPSKASSTYYFKSHVQYFRDLYKSVEECQRILSPAGVAVLVVQDSEYKGIRNDLASITTEMFKSRGLRLMQRSDFRKSVNMRSLNSGSRAYSSGGVPVETVLTFTK